MATGNTSSEKADAPWKEVKNALYDSRLSVTRFSIQFLLVWLVFSYVGNYLHAIAVWVLGIFAVVFQLFINWFCRKKAKEQISPIARNFWFTVWFMTPALIASIPVLWEIGVWLLRPEEKKETNLFEHFLNNLGLLWQLVIPLVALLVAYFALPRNSSTNRTNQVN